MDDTTDTHLASGARPKTPDDLFARFDELGIATNTIEHAPVFTVAESKALRGPIPGCHTKNLFLRNKKGRMWLVVCLESRSVDLKGLGKAIGAGSLSFGSPRRLMSFLGVIPGAVTPFAVVNDTEGAVRVAVDRDILAQEPLNFHPLDNCMTTSIGADDFVRFLEAEEHPPLLLDFDEIPPRD
jgi:Ala-tRNA(Pro) deacylase